MSEFNTVLYKDGVVVTAFETRDKAAYLLLNTDMQNNVYWGYDYTKDPSIRLPIDENTFYDSMVADMRAGESINFAVREAVDGELVGECILWNFSDSNRAELGCRIRPEYHKKGYGRAAFGAVAEYAKNILGLRVWARCHIPNLPSQKMILSNGFVHTKSDDTYHYFEMK